MTITRWTRRSFIRNTATTAAALRIAANSYPLRASPSRGCILNQEQEEGPYYVDREILRSNITEGKPGTPLRLRLTIIATTGCQPVQNAALDIWHCDASGIYSGYTAFNPSGPGGPDTGRGRLPGPPPDFDVGGPPPGGRSKMPPSDKQIFLRGVQLTDANGVVEFTTIFPGHYMGRVNHIHMKVHVGGDSTGPEYHGGHVAHTGQLFFPEEISKRVTQSPPYASHRIHRTTLEEDGIFNAQQGGEAMAALAPIIPGNPSLGYLATLTLGIDAEATPPPADRR